MKTFFGATLYLTLKYLYNKDERRLLMSKEYYLSKSIKIKNSLERRRQQR